MNYYNYKIKPDGLNTFAENNAQGEGDSQTETFNEMDSGNKTSQQIGENDNTQASAEGSEEKSGTQGEADGNQNGEHREPIGGYDNGSAEGGDS